MKHPFLIVIEVPTKENSKLLTTPHFKMTKMQMRVRRLRIISRGQLQKEQQHYWANQRRDKSMARVSELVSNFSTEFSVQPDTYKGKIRLSTNSVNGVCVCVLIYFCEKVHL